eukprot:gnl/Chilomastix_cuspidata/2661.p2 GENE.gnl/Chilomastix_cuspidata/2661~~gnl/Chilomastix_cuspidata/2661.p2  ORF type:complete len:240 (+),score=68.30 gnl/Chilomastix_cuspidata/2661:39-722(+)
MPAKRLSATQRFLLKCKQKGVLADNTDITKKRTRRRAPAPKDFIEYDESKEDSDSREQEEDAGNPPPIEALPPVRSATPLVYFRCVRENSRLRVRIITPGYSPVANCQFPRAIRQEGRVYTAPASQITFGYGSAGTLFYKVRPSLIRVASETETEIDLSSIKIFDVSDEPECIVCMCEEKDAVFIPCGHFCTCMGCYEELVRTSGFGAKCPICRQAIQSAVARADIK